MEIIPSILVKTKEEFEEKIKTAEEVAGVDRIHLDIADGSFVPNSTINGFNEITNVSTDIKIGVHLMVQKPENQIQRWLETDVDKFVVHVESTKRMEQIINDLKENDKIVGIALNPNTSIDDLADYIDEIDFVHFMTVDPGFYGSKFVPEVIEKIKDFHFYYSDVPIEVDGSVNPETIGLLAEAGVSKFIVGSYFWKSKNKKEALETLNKIIENK